MLRNGPRRACGHLIEDGTRERGISGEYRKYRMVPCVMIHVVVPSVTMRAWTLPFVSARCWWAADICSMQLCDLKSNDSSLKVRMNGSVEMKKDHQYKTRKSATLRGTRINLQYRLIIQTRP